MREEGFIVTYYESGPKSLAYLKKTLQVLGKEDFYLVLASHTPVPEELQELCDWYFYEKLNVVDDRKYSHGVAESNLLEHALKRLRDEGVEWTFKMSYDVELVDLSEIWRWRMERRYELVTCEWGESWVGTNSFYARVDFLLQNVRFPKTVEEMFSVNTLLENCWKWDLEVRGLRQRCFSYPHQSVMFGSNGIDQLWYDYSHTEFWVQDGRFWLSHSEPARLKVSIWDYFTDLCIYKSEGLMLGPEPVWIAPHADMHLHSKNGCYAEIGTRPEVRHTKVLDFRAKHPLAKKWRLFKQRHDSPSLLDLENHREEAELDRSPWGLASRRKLLMGERATIVDPDPERRELMRQVYGPSSLVSIIDR